MLCLEPHNLFLDPLPLELDLGLLNVKGGCWWSAFVLFGGELVFGELVVGDVLEEPASITEMFKSHFGEVSGTENDLSSLSIGFKHALGRRIAVFCLGLAVTAGNVIRHGLNADIGVDSPAVRLPELYDLESLGRCHCVSNVGFADGRCVFVILLGGWVILIEGKLFIYSHLCEPSEL